MQNTPTTTKVTRAEVLSWPKEAMTSAGIQERAHRPGQRAGTSRARWSAPDEEDHARAWSWIRGEDHAILRAPEGEVYWADLEERVVVRSTRTGGWVEVRS